MDKQTIYSKFKQTVEKYPHAPAVIEDERVITYSELDVMVDAIMAKFYQSAPAFVWKAQRTCCRRYSGRECR